jgi:hypothetical protein
MKIQIPNKDTAKGLITMRGAVGGFTTFCKNAENVFFFIIHLGTLCFIVYEFVGTDHYTIAK